MNRIVIYTLAEELRGDPEQVAAAQALTLDASRPNIGLKGKNGLFGSSQWWANIHAGLIPSRRVVGVIEDVYVAGQGESAVPNAIDLRLQDGEVRMEGIYVNRGSDIAEYRHGRKIEFVYAADELKAAMPDGSAGYLDIVVEVAIG